jgi:hypothetical protein
MTAGFSKIDPSCGAPDQIVFVGTVELHKFDELDPRYTANPATAVLSIDVLAAEAFGSTEFQDITVTLEVLGPPTAVFTDHGRRNNYHWDVPAPVPGGWTENTVASPRVRLRVDKSNLLSGGGGLTFYVGVRGVNDQGLHFTAVAAAAEVRAHVSSCAITVTDLKDGDRLAGYLA